MRTTLFAGLLVLAGAAAVSCTSDEVNAPVSASVLSLGSTGDVCDPTHTECPPPPPPPECDPHTGTCEPPPCDEHNPCAIDGRMTGGGGQIIIGDVFVSRGFTLHCDITLSNNLEINWPDNKWHLDKPITSANCIDDPAIAPEPPAAPFDTFIGVATGELNGVGGAVVTFTFADAGEPGGANDRASIKITDAGGNVVLDIPMSFLTRGNIQAHYDQPHKNQ